MNTIQIPEGIVILFLGSIFSLQGWTLIELVSLKARFWAMQQKLNDLKCVSCQFPEL